ncbi:MAG: NAD(P)H-dependent glycerol-3-phosphate dehydrogenase, partial [Nitrospinota bacterium]
MQEEAKGFVSVIGAGAWGTTLANLLAEKGRPVRLWVYEEELCREMEEARENRLYLPGILLHSGISFTNELKEAAEAEVLVSVAPTHAVRGIWERLSPHLVSSRPLIVSASKGLEEGSLMTMTQVIGETLGRLRPELKPRGLGCISGPNFAPELSRKLPSAAVAASSADDSAREIQTLFSTPYYRLYTQRDVLGAELGGALKNVIAIASGISDGLSLGDNARAALLVRGMAEISRLGACLGAEVRTFSGLAGFGDLVLTCCGNLSRNRRVGLKIGQGERLDEILGGMREVAEGVFTTRAAVKLAERVGVELPICREVEAILFDR